MKTRCNLLNRVFLKLRLFGGKVEKNIAFLL